MRIDPHGTTSFNFGPPQWQYVRDMPALSNRADSWHGIAKFDSPSISLFGKQVRPSYGTLKAGDGTVLNLPDRQLGRWPFYITTIAIDGVGLL